MKGAMIPFCHETCHEQLGASCETRGNASPPECCWAPYRRSLHGVLSTKKNSGGDDFLGINKKKSSDFKKCTVLLIIHSGYH